MGNILKWLKRLDVITVTLLMFAVFITVMLQIFSRIMSGFVAIRVVPWTVEMGEILLVAIIWLGIGLAVLDNSHVRFDMLLSKLPHRKKKSLYVIGNVVFALFLCFLAYHTIDLLQFHIRANNRTPMLGWNRAFIRAPVLIGCITGSLRMLVQAWLFAMEKIPLPTGEYAVETVAAKEKS